MVSLIRKEVLTMQLIDEILEYLHFHPLAKRSEIERIIDANVSSATVKRALAKAIEEGLVVSSGVGKATVYSITPKAHLLRTVDLDTYYAKTIDERKVQSGYNFELIREEIP